MMNRIRVYFGSLPFKFSEALLATGLVIFLSSFQTYLMWSEKFKPIEGKVLFFPFLNYGVWLLIAPLLFQLMLQIFDSTSSDASTVKRNSLIVVLGLFFTFGHELIALLIYNPINYFYYLLNDIKDEPFVLDIQSGVFGLTKTFIEYWVIYFGLLHFHSKKKFRLAESRNLQLESSLIKAQMSALKNQLHPHFLFNSFNTISALMEEDIELSQRMIAKLAALLRMILKNGEAAFVSLEEELELAKLYLEVEQIRFKGRLVTRYSIDSSTKKIKVPTLLLQPIVENAIKHGFYKKLDECEISIRTYRQEDFLIIEIADNGGGSKNESTFSFGLGLKNVEERLKVAYEDKYELQASRMSYKNGFVVEIRIRQ